MKSRNNQRVSRTRGSNFLDKDSINGINKEIIWKKGNIGIIIRKVRVSKVR